MKKTEIAKTIIDICHEDASFCFDIKGGDPQSFLSEITDDMPDRDFLFSVDKYLATFKVWGQLYFYKKISAYISAFTSEDMIMAYSSPKRKKNCRF